MCGVAAAERCCSAEHCVATDTQGRFALPEHAAASTALVASAVGYATRVYGLDEGAEAAAGRPEIILDVAPEGASLAGSIHDLYGGPVPGAIVSVLGEHEAGVQGSTLSALDGSFAVQAARGERLLCAHAEGYSRVCQTVYAPSEGNALVLMPQSEIVGRVVMATSGDAIPGATVSAANLDGLRVPARRTQSRADGSFGFSALPAGGYALTASSERGRSAEVRVALGVGEASEPVILTAVPAVRLTGRVSLGGRPCPDGLLQLSGPIHAFESVGSDGTVRIDGVLPGTYQAMAVCGGAPMATLLEVRDGPVHHEWSFAEDTERAALDPEPARGAEEPRPVAQGGTIKIRVINGDASAAPLRVFANALTPQPLQARQSGAEFILDELPSGDYQVHLFDDVEHAQAVRIDEPGQLAEVQLAVSERATIAGRVLTEGGAPVADAWVSYSRADLSSGDALVGSPVLADEDGAFSVGVTPGARYTIVVNSPAGDGSARGVHGGQRVDIRVAPSLAISAARRHRHDVPGQREPY